MKRVLSLLLAGLLTAFALSGCQGEESLVPGGVESTDKTVTSSNSQPVAKDQNLNPLTGEYNLKDQAVGQRPASVMVNNIKKAWPQSGIGSADICYEVVAEGGITRIMAVFADYRSMPKVGSVRSVRHYYTDLSSPLNTIFVHWGGSDPGYDALKNRKIDDIDGMSLSSLAFERDQKLKNQKGQEYSNFTNGSLIQKGIDKKKIKTAGTPDPGFKFDKNGGLKGDTPAADVNVKFSGYVTANFKYDTASNKYLKSEFGQPQIDNNTGKQVAVTNVFVLYADIHSYQGHKSLMDVDFSGGSGYYISNGTVKNLTWTKGSYNKPFQFKVQGSNEELTVNPGNSWVCVVSDEFKSSTVIK